MLRTTKSIAIDLLHTGIGDTVIRTTMANEAGNGGVTATV
jgi:hypothetical protein